MNNNQTNVVNIKKLSVKSAPSRLGSTRSLRSVRSNKKRAMSNPVIVQPRSQNEVVSSPLSSASSADYENVNVSPYNMLEDKPLDVVKNYIKFFDANSNMSHTKAISKYNSSQLPLKFTFHIIKLKDPSRYDVEHFFLVTVSDVVYINRHIVDMFLKGLNKTIGKTLAVTGNALCSGAINKGYIIEQFHDNSFCILSFGINKKNLRSKQNLNFVDNIGKYDLLGLSSVIFTNTTELPKSLRLNQLMIVMCLSFVVIKSLAV